MPYIGKSPVGGGFHKLDALTASATDTYALTLGSAAYYPETANQLLVSLNGVIQAPQDSFTVSGSNLIFDSALTASDSIDFVVALGDVLGVGSVTDGAITTAKIGNDAVTKAKIGTTELDLATIKDSTGTNTAMTIDSNGTIQMPQKPAWRLGLDVAQAETTTGGHDVIFDKTTGENCFVQGDLTYTAATGILEVGVAGVYQINSTIRVDDVGSGYLIMRILINNDSSGANETYSIEGAPASNYQTLTASDTFKLAAGDEIKIQMFVSADTSWSIAADTAFFSGFLVG